MVVNPFYAVTNFSQYVVVYVLVSEEFFFQHSHRACAQSFNLFQMHRNIGNIEEIIAMSGYNDNNDFKPLPFARA